jgi:prefoldin subunit 5
MSRKNKKYSKKSNNLLPGIIFRENKNISYPSMFDDIEINKHEAMFKNNINNINYSLEKKLDLFYENMLSIINKNNIDNRKFLTENMNNYISYLDNRIKQLQEKLTTMSREVRSTDEEFQVVYSQEGNLENFTQENYINSNAALHFQKDTESESKKDSKFEKDNSKSETNYAEIEPDAVEADSVESEADVAEADSVEAADVAEVDVAEADSVEAEVDSVESEADSVEAEIDSVESEANSVESEANSVESEANSIEFDADNIYEESELDSVESDADNDSDSYDNL